MMWGLLLWEIGEFMRAKPLGYTDFLVEISDSHVKQKPNDVGAGFGQNLHPAKRGFCPILSVKKVVQSAISICSVSYTIYISFRRGFLDRQVNFVVWVGERNTEG